MKKLFVIILVGALILSSVAFAQDINDLQFGMTMEEVKKIMGEPDAHKTPMTSYGPVVSFAYHNQPVSKFTADAFSAIFIDDSFIAKHFTFYTDETGNIYDYLKKALEQKYGDGIENEEKLYILLEFYGLEEDIIKQLPLILPVTGGGYATWSTEEETDIIIFHLKDLTLIAYVNRPELQEIKFDISGL